MAVAIVVAALNMAREESSKKRNGYTYRGALSAPSPSNAACLPKDTTPKLPNGILCIYLCAFRGLEPNEGVAVAFLSAAPQFLSTVSYSEKL